MISASFDLGTLMIPLVGSSCDYCFIGLYYYYFGDVALLVF